MIEDIICREGDVLPGSDTVRVGCGGTPSREVVASEVVGCHIFELYDELS